MSLISNVTLEDPDGVEVPLLYGSERLIERLDGLLGIRVREVVQARPSRHGSRNRTRYLDDRVISANGATFHGATAAGAWANYDAVASALAGAVDTPRLLRWTRGDVDLQTLVQTTELQSGIEVSRRCVMTQYQLRAEDPRAYAQELETAFGAALSAGGGGKVYPYTYPRNYVSSSGGIAEVDNTGSLHTPPVLRVYGTVAGAFKLRLLSTGEDIVFSEDATVAVGDFLEVDVYQRTVKLNGVADRASVLDHSANTWWELPPGEHTVQLIAGSFDASARVDVLYRPAYT